MRQTGAAGQKWSAGWCVDGVAKPPSRNASTTSVQQPFLYASPRPQNRDPRLPWHLSMTPPMLWYPAEGSAHPLPLHAAAFSLHFPTSVLNPSLHT